MKDALLKKIQYLLSFKLNEDIDVRYSKLLERIFYELIERMEEVYNYKDEIPSHTYYNMLLNKFNKNIKTILIPADNFRYHSSGFLELSVNLKKSLDKYKQAGLEVDKELKEEIMKKNYFFYLLQVAKSTNKGIGFSQRENQSFKDLERYLNEYQAITLANFKKYLKKEYKVTCSDGTNFGYYVYTKCFDSKEILNMNAISMLEVVGNKKLFMNAELDGNVDILKEIDKKYDHLLGKLSNEFTTTTLISEFLKRIQAEENMYKKIEYFKKLNIFLFQMFDYKVTTVLNSKDDNKIKSLLDEVHIMEMNMLYNLDSKLHDNLKHIAILKNIKNKLSNYLNQDKTKVDKKYTIYSPDKSRKLEVSSSVQPIQVKQEYVSINIKDVKNIQNHLLIKVDFSILSFNSHANKIYSDIYLSLNELKYLYSSSDLNVFTKESESIRTSIANRILNPTIMDIIKSERNNFLGEFVYSVDEERCIIYKNKSIEEILEKVM